jgi:TolA-binding protein
VVDPATAYAAAWNATLAKAEAELSRGEFTQAQRTAETLLRPDVAKAVRARALLVCGDAAYALRSYRVAAARYGEVLSKHAQTPEAVRAQMGLGWVELREGNRQRAQRIWTALAETLPGDPRAPLALALAAEVAAQSGDLTGAHALLDRIIARHPRTTQAEGALLSRGIVLLRRNREDDAVRDIGALVRSGGKTAIAERRRLLEALGAPRPDAAVGALTLIIPGPSGQLPAGDGLERFATSYMETNDKQGAPYVLHGLVLVGATDRGWTDPAVSTVAIRLVDDFPAYPPAPVLLTRVAASAAAAGQWPTARRCYATLVARYPGTPIARSVGAEYAEALVWTSAPAEARAQLEQPGAAETPRALLLLAELNESMGDRRGALTAYDRLLREHPRAERTTASLLAHASLLEDFGQAEPARGLLRRIVGRAQGDTAAEAAYRLAALHAVAREHEAAVEWHLTAVYVAPGSRWARMALLGAGAELTVLKETKEALALYSRLIPARPGVDRVEDRQVSGEAAHRAAEIFRDAGRHEDALNMYLTAAHLTAGTTAERRALVGAVRCLVALGDRPAAEAIYRRLLESSTTEPEHIANARQALQRAR